MNLVAANVNWRIRSALAISAVLQRRLRKTVHGERETDYVPPNTRFFPARYFLTVNGTENWVFSHIIFSTPPPEGF
jgi:hypothetical protein